MEFYFSGTPYGLKTFQRKKYGLQVNDIEVDTSRLNIFGTVDKY